MKIDEFSYCCTRSVQGGCLEKMNIAEKCGLVRFSKKYIQKARKFILELAEFIGLLRVFLLLGKNRFNNIKIQDADKQYHFHLDTSNSLLPFHDWFFFSSLECQYSTRQETFICFSIKILISQKKKKLMNVCLITFWVQSTNLSAQQLT